MANEKMKAGNKAIYNFDLLQKYSWANWHKHTNVYTKQSKFSKQKLFVALAGAGAGVGAVAGAGEEAITKEPLLLASIEIIQKSFAN